MRESAERIRNKLFFLFCQLGRRANLGTNPPERFIKLLLVGRVNSADVPESVIVGKDAQKLLDKLMGRALGDQLGHDILAYADRQRREREYFCQLRVSKELGDLNRAELRWLLPLLALGRDSGGLWHTV